MSSSKPPLAEEIVVTKAAAKMRITDVLVFILFGEIENISKLVSKRYRSTLIQTLFAMRYAILRRTHFKSF